MGFGLDLYVVGGVIRFRLSFLEILYLYDVDICIVEGEMEDFVWCKGVFILFFFSFVEN